MLSRRKNTLVLALAIGVGFAFVAPVGANVSFRPIGDPIASGSWSQQWELDGTGAGFPSGDIKTDLIMLEILTPGNTFDNDPGSSPPSSPLFDFTDAGGSPDASWGWSNLAMGDTQVSASGDGVLTLRFFTHHQEGTAPVDGFEMRINWWDADNLNPDALAFEAVTALYLNSTDGWLLSSTTVSPLGRGEALGNPVPAVPVPGAIVLGMMGMGMIGVARRRLS